MTNFPGPRSDPVRAMNVCRAMVRKKLGYTPQHKLESTVDDAAMHMYCSWLKFTDENPGAMFGMKMAAKIAAQEARRRGVDSPYRTRNEVVWSMQHFGVDRADKMDEEAMLRDVRAMNGMEKVKAACKGRQWEYLMATLYHGNMRYAAESLGVTRQSVAQSLGRLMDKLGLDVKLKLSANNRKRKQMTQQQLKGQYSVALCEGLRHSSADPEMVGSGSGFDRMIGGMA